MSQGPESTSVTPFDNETNRDDVRVRIDVVVDISEPSCNWKWARQAQTVLRFTR